MTVYANVIINISNRKLDRSFQYVVPSTLESKLSLGSRVLVPFGKRKVDGYVISFNDQKQVDNPKPILDVLEDLPSLGREAILLSRWMANQYLCPLVTALRCFLPPGLPTVSKRQVALKCEGDELLQILASTLDPVAASILQYLKKRKIVGEQTLYKRFGAKIVAKILDDLEQNGYVERFTAVIPQARQKPTLLVHLAKPAREIENIIQDMAKRAPKQALILRILLEQDGGTQEELLRKAEASRSILGKLVQKGLIRVEKVYSYSQEAVPEFPVSEKVSLFPQQAKALNAISDCLQAREAGTFLLFGVTGSGKTEIYLQAIAQVLQAGRQAITLVPEISLTPQMVARFRQRFGHQVAVLHSGLSDRERYDEWYRISTGQATVVLGARSAVFAPVNNLGLIIVDEEHESAYKQEVNPKYDARQVAEQRARLHNAVLILGSATPSLESFHYAEQKKYILLTLGNRIWDRPLPPVHLVDMRQELATGNSGIFSRMLLESISDRLKKREQTILFLNRRGYANFILCKQCGFVFQCPHCMVTLTFHRWGGHLCCHYCGYRQKLSHTCPSCGKDHLRPMGLGTQRVEEEVARIFPTARLLRVDADSTSQKGSCEHYFHTFERADADILIGTQMVAKGLDFPKVTLVGIISADTTLYLPDFRSREKTFQLLTQVAGRAGRGDIGGEVIIQTYSPSDESIVAASRHDYLAFYRGEIQVRRKLKYPPFTHLVRVLLYALDESKVVAAARSLNRMLIAELQGCQVLGPSPAPISKLKDYYRWQVMLKGDDLENIRQQLQPAIRAFVQQREAQDVGINIDIDPSGM